MGKENLFKEFNPVSKSEWIDKVRTDLKGKPIEDLDWSMGGIEMTPFFHKDDLEDTYNQISAYRNDNDWDKGAIVVVSNAVGKCNKIILDELQGGATAIKIITQDVDLDAIGVGDLFKDIQHEWISTHFVFKSSDNVLGFLANFHKEIENKEQSTSEIKGSIQVPREHLSYWEIFEYAATNLPQFRLIQCQELSQEDKVSLSTVDILVDVLEQLISVYEEGQKQGVALELLISKTKLSLTTGDLYYETITKIRAMRLLWGLLIKSYGIDEESGVEIECCLNASCQSDNPNYNMIKNTSQTMAALIGGVDLMFTSPMRFNGEQNETGRRVARNINHILQLESFMGRVVDPAAGSYFFESATDAICKEAWKTLQSKEGI